MKKLFLAVCLCLMLLIGLKDGRVGEFDGVNVIRFVSVAHEGKQIQCIVFIFQGQQVVVPVELIEGIALIPDKPSI